MPVIEFGPWLPDQPRLGNRCVTATNVFPKGNGYGPIPSPVAVSDAVPAEVVGAISLHGFDGTARTFVGTATKLFQIVGTSVNDVSKNLSTYSSSTFWRFAEYGSRLIATNGVDAPQAFDLGTDTEFADLPSAPVHNFPIVVRDTVVALDCASGNPIQWSANNDSEEWTAACGGGSQPIFDGGQVIGGTGGEFGIILQEGAMTRMNFVGGDLRFTFDRIEGAIGCIAPDSIVQYKGRTFYLSEEGFQVFNGAESQNISDEIVSDTFFSEVDWSNRTKTRGALDPKNSIVMWSFPISGGSKMFIYNYRLGQWSESDVELDALHTSISAADGESLGGFDSLDKLARFTGSDLTAVVSTGELQIARERGAMVRYVRGLVDSAYNATVGKKTDLSDSETTVTGSSNVNGKVSTRAQGRYHRFQITPTAAFTELTGVVVDASASGQRV